MHARLPNICPATRGKYRSAVRLRTPTPIRPQGTMRALRISQLRLLCARRVEGVTPHCCHQSQAASTVASASPPHQLENSISAEDRELNLELIRRHNSSLKQLKGQTIGARIFRTDKRFVFLDTGFNKHVKFARKALQISQLISSRDGGVRTSPEDFRVGDVLKFVVEEIETAYGDMQLSTEREVTSDKFQRVWDIIKQAMRENKPVMGRVLNTVPGGYCIGIAGVVGFCPFSSIAGPTARRIGVLQPFNVLRMEDSRQNIVLIDAQKTPLPNRNNIGYKQDSLASRYSPQHVRSR